MQVALPETRVGMKNRAEIGQSAVTLGKMKSGVAAAIVLQKPDGVTPSPDSISI